MRHTLALVLLLLPGAFFAQSNPPKTFQEEYKTWSRTHPNPKPNASPQEKEAFNQELAQAAVEWIQHWPDDAAVRLWRLRSLSKLKSTSNEQLEEAGEAVVKAAKEHPFPGIRFRPYETEVVLIWTERNMRPERCLQLAREGVLAVERSQTANPSAAKQYSSQIALGLFETLRIEADLARELKKVEIVESAVDQMKEWLDENPGDSAWLENMYLLQAAELAEAEGHKADALGSYSRLASQSPKDAFAETHASALWKELGGTDKGFATWMSFVDQQSTLVAANHAKSQWTAMDKPLTAFRGTDMNGRIWSIEDLKGKTTLVNIWATWCPPCRAELPKVQKLFEQLRDRKDLQVVTVSTDEKPAAIAPFTNENHYTFPVIPISPTVVNEMVGFEGIPRTWIVDSKGSVRLEAIGYDSADWPDQVLRQLATMK
jgi:thiol-disulfide isomerase/thioredoxin